MKRILSGILVVALLLGVNLTMPSTTRANESIKRYTVLVVDTSSEVPYTSGDKIIYTAGSPIEYTKKAATKFCVDANG